MTATVPAREVLVTLLNELMLADFQRIARVNEVDVAPASEPQADSEQPSAIVSPASSFYESTDAASIECNSTAVNSSGETLSFNAGTATQDVAQVVSASTDPQEQSWRATLDQLTGAASVTVTPSVSNAVAARENYFAWSDYLNRDVKAGILQDRSGMRVIAFSDSYTSGLLDGLVEDCGERWPVVMYRCGEFYGRRQMEHLEKTLTNFFQTPLHNLPTTQVHTTLTEAWATMGWGRINFDLTWLRHGFMHVTIKGALLPAAFVSAGRAANGQFIDHLSAGTLAGMFAHASNADIVVYQIACESAGAECCEFVVGLRSKLEAVPNWICQGKTATGVLHQLQNAG